MSPTKSLFDVGSRRISIFIVSTYVSLGCSGNTTRIMRRTLKNLLVITVCDEQVTEDPPCLKLFLNGKHELLASFNIFPCPKPYVQTRIHTVDLDFLDPVVQCLINLLQSTVEVCDDAFRVLGVNYAERGRCLCLLTHLSMRSRVAFQTSRRWRKIMLARLEYRLRNETVSEESEPKPSDASESNATVVYWDKQSMMEWTDSSGIAGTIYSQEVASLRLVQIHLRNAQLGGTRISYSAVFCVAITSRVLDKCRSVVRVICGLMRYRDNVIVILEWRCISYVLGQSIETPLFVYLPRVLTQESASLKLEARVEEEVVIVCVYWLLALRVARLVFRGAIVKFGSNQDFLALADDPTSPKVDEAYYDPEGDILLLKSLLNSDPSPSLNQGNYLPEIRKELKVCNSAESLIDKHPEVELKDLPPHLEYAFLADNNKLPVIIAKDLSDDEKTALIKVLKSRKQAIAWKLSDIKGINLEFCSHKILMKDDYEPAVQHQRRVNPKIHDVIKKEVEKLLDAGLIYPISDSPWVSPVHCVPKKGGMTIVTNDENELVPTTLVTG
ncbi:hypothetical protein Tco_1123960 [Tanacetum coccineum]|uniref:Reverse transcriptase domain-containing protein n=1 Tax=Tanacetum coccineum TaxID=301880 RepID=A0ABQ5J4U4_9ASTR